MKTKEILRLLPKKEAMRKRLASLQSQRKRLREEAEKLDRQLYDLLLVDEVFEGQPLHIWEPSSKSLGISHADETINRSGEVYKNANHPNKSYWGFRLKGDGLANVFNEEWFGAYWPSKKECVLYIKRWAAHGIKPDQKKYGPNSVGKLS